MLFGLRNSGQTFQQMMDMVIAIRQGVFCYLDILMLLSDEQSHSCHLLGLVAGVRFGTELQECVLGQSQMEFLGHSILFVG
jgi:hypothetical protein